VFASALDSLMAVEHVSLTACVAEAVREVLCSRLLPAWMQRLDGNFTELLHRLDVENCAQTALDTLKAIFRGMPTEELLQNRAQLDNRYISTPPPRSLFISRVSSRHS